VVHFLRAGVERPLTRGLGFSQLPANRRDEALKVLNVLFRRRGDVLSSLLGLSKPRHSLHANKLKPSRAHEGKGEFPRARVHLRIIRSSKEGQMTVPFGLMLRNTASELPHLGAVVSFHLPSSLKVVERGIVRGYTEKPEDALVLYRDKLRSVVRKDRVGDAVSSNPRINER